MLLAVYKLNIAVLKGALFWRWSFLSGLGRAIIHNVKVSCFAPVLQNLTAFTITTSEQYRRSDEKNNVYFVEHLNRMLNIDQLASYKVYDSMACGLHCIRHELCISVNFAVEADLTGHSCALLKADRFRYPNKLNWNNSYHHYSLAVRKKFINAKIIPKNSYQICFRLKPRGEYYSNRNWGFRGK